MALLSASQGCSSPSAIRPKLIGDHLGRLIEQRRQAAEQRALGQMVERREVGTEAPVDEHQAMFAGTGRQQERQPVDADRFGRQAAKVDLLQGTQAGVLPAFLTGRR